MHMDRSSRVSTQSAPGGLSSKWRRLEALCARARSATLARLIAMIARAGSATRHPSSARLAAGRSRSPGRDPLESSLSAPLRAIANQRGGGGNVPTYIMLSTLTPEGVQTVKNNPQRILEVNKEVEQLGATVKAQWATLGHVDFISVIEAPDEGTIARVSLELGSRGTARYETLSAIPIDDFINSL